MTGKWLLIILAIIVVVVVIAIFATRIAMANVATPDNLGINDGKFAPCPATPNCVNSQASAGRSAIAPIPYSIDTAEAQAIIVEILESQARTEIVTNEPGYIHAVSRSLTMNFPDDTEFYFDEPAGLIHMRAAARVGQSDLDVNQNRLESIRTQFNTRRR